MAFAHAGAGHAHELRALPQLRDRARADVAHPGAHAADHLVDELRQLAAVRNHAFDAFGHELVHVLDARLTVALLRALHHRADRANAAHDLDRAALELGR